ncbi:MAG TPA: TraB/GumN family protein [Steroidobacteraceae bacterium]|nr:TraB/GumN family protein [Steroidobacteraceae bacterium]
MSSIGASRSGSLAALLAALALLCPAMSGAAALPTQIAAQAAPVQVVISGRYRGPKLWRVSKDGHELWVLGTVAPLPKRMVWQTEDIQRLLRQTQEVIPAWPSLSIGFHPFTALHLYALWRKAQTNPDNLPLQAVLPPDLYARFGALKLRYAPRDRRIEQLRPILAARRLYDDTLATSDLTPHNDIQRTVLELARQEGVPIHKDKLLVKDPVDVMRDLTAVPRAAEITCLRSVVTRLETDVGPMQARARAWALGDVALLRRLPHTDNRDTCLEAVSGSARVRALLAQAQQDWMSAAVQALAQNRTTLALQSMDLLLGPGGTLATFQRMGFRVEGP